MSRPFARPDAFVRDVPTPRVPAGSDAEIFSRVMCMDLRAVIDEAQRLGMPSDGMSGPQLRHALLARYRAMRVGAQRSSRSAISSACSSSSARICSSI